MRGLEGRVVPTKGGAQACESETKTEAMFIAHSEQSRLHL